MANINPTIRVTTGKINTVSDAQVGGASQDGLGRAPGQLGQIVEFSEAEAQKIDTALHGGKYQYVKFKAGSTAANAKGQFVIWDDHDAFVVTPDVAAATLGEVAGVTLNVVAKGEHGFIQVSGLATCLCKATVTGTTDGSNAIAVADSSIGKVDMLADATAVTGLEAKARVGTFAEAPANGALKLVQLVDFSAGSA